MEPIEGNPAVDAEIKEQLDEESAEMQEYSAYIEQDDFTGASTNDR